MTYCAESVIDRKAFHRPFDLDSYLPFITDLTFSTELITISHDEARAICNYYRQVYLSRENAIGSDDIAVLELLESRIANVLNSTHMQGKSIFCRMSNRSPKDGIPLNGLQLKSLYCKCLGQIVRDENAAAMSADNYSNLKMVAMCETQMKALRCENAPDIMSRLLSSERVFSDLNLALDASKEDPSDVWGTFLALREWNEDLCHDMEFRCFVHNHKLVAISQYNHYIMIPSLQTKEAKHKVRNTIYSFWQRRVRDRLIQSDATVGTNSYSSYVCDIAILSTGELIVIELNPFATSTGGSLFHWTIDHDILFDISDGRAESHSDDGAELYGYMPVFRVRESILEHIEELVEINLEMFDAAEREPVGTWSSQLEFSRSKQWTHRPDHSLTESQPPDDSNRCVIQ